MKGKLRIVSTGLIAVLALAIVVTGVARSRQGFFPFDTDRELNSNQILFPDGGSAAGDDEQSGGDDSYWQQDDADDMTGQNGSNTGYLFGQGQQTPGGTGTVTTGTGSGSTSSSGSGNGDNVYELTDRPSSEGDLILPGGGGGNAPSGGTVPGGNGTGTGGGNGGTGGENGGNLTPGGDTPSGPVPGYGSSSKDELNTDYVRPSYAGKGDEKFDDSTSDRLEKSGNYEVRISKASSANQASGEALYRGQQQVDAAAIFQSIEAFVWDHDSDLNFYWTLDDLCVNGEDDSKSYIKINGIAFGEYPTETVTEFPVDIPADEDYITIYVSYRFSLGDEWTSYIREDFLGPTPGVSYELYNSKVTLLDKVLTKEGETISRDSIVNLYGQYIDVWTDYVNLYDYQNKIVGGKTTKVTELFPGWTEDGKSVPFIYSPTVGRHVLEPANRVALDDAYQVEVFTHWIKSNYEVSANTEVDYGASYAYLQTLTNYNGSDKADDHVYRLTVPQYIQAVEFVYHMGMTVNYIDLPSSVVYIDTNGIPSIDDDWLLYDIGLRVVDGYNVAEGNPRYTSEDGILYNLDKTEMLGVPTGKTELTVKSGVKKVVLPYQNSLKTLLLEPDENGVFPEINYNRLRSDCRIVVPDDYLAQYLSSESDVLQRRGFVVVPKSSLDQSENGGYILRDGFLYTTDFRLHQIMRNSVHFVALSDDVNGVEASAFVGFENELSVIMLPKSGEVPDFDVGCFDGLEKLTVACYSEKQRAAMEQYAKSSYCNIKLRMVEEYEGYSYLDTDGGPILLSVPDGIEYFDGSFLTPDGTKTAAAIGDRVFLDSWALKWVVLPEETKGIGFEAFKGSNNLEGVLIKAKDSFLISDGAFDECAALRFVGSNAQKCLLEDQDFSLRADGYTDTFLYCLSGSDGYNMNWTQFVPESDIVSYDIVDCGGTKVLYGVGNDGDEWLALRAGFTVDGEVNLPVSTLEIFCCTFMGTKTADDTCFTVNFDELKSLGWIDQMAFHSSSLGKDVVLPSDITAASKAFFNCDKLESIVLPGNAFNGVNISDEALSDCNNLGSVTFGPMNSEGAVFASLFAGTPVTEITFTSTTPPSLALFGQGSPFYFEMDQEQSGLLSVHVPEGSELDYLMSWEYAFAGYPTYGNETGYQVMWNELSYQLHNTLGREPTTEELTAEIDSRLLTAQNRIRALIGMEQSDEVFHPYTYTVDENGIITLTGVHGIGSYTSLTAGEMEMPINWALDIIAAGAFRENPEIRVINVPSTLVGINDGVFDGVELDPDDPFDTIHFYLDSCDSIFGLNVKEEGKIFDFGVDLDRIQITSFDMFFEEDGAALATYVQFWTAPMAGYSDVSELEKAVRKKLGPDASDADVRAEMEKILLEAENRVRKMLTGAQPTDVLTFRFELEG